MMRVQLMHSEAECRLGWESGRNYRTGRLAGGAEEDAKA